MVRSVIYWLLASAVMLGAVLICAYSVRTSPDADAIPPESLRPFPDAGISYVPEDQMTAEAIEALRLSAWSVMGISTVWVHAF